MSAKTLQERLLAVLCPVCRTAMHGPSSCCSRCETAHHADCWEYAGGCAVYGCLDHRGSQKRVPVSRPPSWIDPFNVLVALILVSLLLQPFVPHDVNQRILSRNQASTTVNRDISVHDLRSRLGKLVIQAGRGQPVIIRVDGHDPVQLVRFDPSNPAPAGEGARPTK